MDGAWGNASLGDREGGGRHPQGDRNQASVPMGVGCWDVEAQGVPWSWILEADVQPGYLRGRHLASMGEQKNLSQFGFTSTCPGVDAMLPGHSRQGRCESCRSCMTGALRTSNNDLRKLEEAIERETKQRQATEDRRQTRGRSGR